MIKILLQLLPFEIILISVFLYNFDFFQSVSPFSWLSIQLRFPTSKVFRGLIRIFIWHDLSLSLINRLFILFHDFVFETVKHLGKYAATSLLFLVILHEFLDFVANVSLIADVSFIKLSDVSQKVVTLQKIAI